MPDRYTESHIRQLPMFQNITAAQMDLVVRAFQLLRFEPGQIVVQQGNPTQGLFMVVSGGGVLTRQQPDGTKATIGELGPAGTLDQSALFQQGRESATLQITKPTEVLFLSRRRMDTILSYYPEIRQQLGATNTGATADAQRPIRTQSRDASGHGLNIHRENEEIILIRRRHPWSFIRRGWMCVLIFVFFAAAGVATLPIAPAISWVLFGAGVVIAGLLMVYFFFEWRNDSIIVTDQRVIQIERVITSFSVTINEIPINQIQEVNTELPQGDLFARILRYGDIELKNASDTGNLILDMVPQPEEIQDAIFANREKREQMAEETRQSAIRAEVERQLGLNTDNTPTPTGTITSDSPTHATPSAITRSLSPAPMRFTNASGDTVIRKHVTVWLAAIAAPTLVVIGGFTILAMSIATRTGWLSQLGMPLAFGLLILGGLWFWWSDWDWRNDMYIISDDKVTLIHKRPLWLQNEVEQIRLERVDNVLSETKGLVDSMFQRGDVKISLVGEGLDGAKVFRKIHRPHEIQAELSRRQARARSSQEQAEDRRQREAIKEYLSAYHQAVTNDDPDPVPDQPADTAPEAGGTAPHVQPIRRHDGNRPPGVPQVHRERAPQQQPQHPPRRPPAPPQADDDPPRNRKPPPPPSLPTKPPNLP